MILSSPRAGEVARESAPAGVSVRSARSKVGYGQACGGGWLAQRMSNLPPPARGACLASPFVRALHAPSLAACGGGYRKCHDHPLVIVGVFCAGAVITFVGTLLIERAHRPRGRFIDIGGFPQHVVELGPRDAQDALPVAVLHGAGANLEDMHLALAEHLAARRRIILVDRPGLGFSARRAEEGASPAYQAAVLRDVLDRLGVERAILVGHSWSGALALTFALDFPERTAGLVLVAPATHPGVWRMNKLNALLAGPVGWLFAARWRSRSVRS